LTWQSTGRSSKRQNSHLQYWWNSRNH